MAAWISTPSAPASMASAAARAKSRTVEATSSEGSSRGAGMSCSPVGVKICPIAATGEGPTGVRPWGVLSGCPMRPVCMSWMNRWPPASCTASVTWRHPATWASWWRPGVRV